MSHEPEQTFAVAGITVNVASLEAAVALITTSVAAGETFSVFTINLDHAVKLKSSGKFREAYRRARFVTADGFPIVLMGRLQGSNVSRATGADMVEPLCAAAARLGFPVFLFGSSETTLAESSRRLKARHKGLAICGALSPPRDFDPESAQADGYINRIKASGARLCFIALGAPKQEIFATRCLERRTGTALLGVGAALDFIADQQQRAPAFFQRHGLEWLWRLSHDPRRLTARYARCLIVFCELLAGQFATNMRSQLTNVR